MSVLVRLNIAGKVALVALLLHALAFPDLPQYEGKGIGPRLALYPVSIWLVPLVWWLVWKRRGRALRYPHLIDICVALPFTIDTAGNAANLYDTIDWWDDVMHLVTWVPWVLAFGLAIRERSNLRRVDVAVITIGFGAATHIVWEVLEYFAFIRDNPAELDSAYTDTIGDLVMSLSGSITGGLLVATVLFSVGAASRWRSMTSGDGVGAHESSLRVVIVGLMLAMSLPAFDLLILATAAKAVNEDIGGNVAWMFISFQITLVASMPLYGKLGDIYGRKRTFQTSVVLFVLASVLCGLVTSSAQLVIARALQGAAGGGITGQTQAVLADIVPPRERGKVAWVAPTVWVVAGMSGPFLGGFFVDHLSWRWIFFINAPLGMLAFFCIGYGFRAARITIARSIDYAGALYIVGAVSLLSFVASAGGDLYPWTSPFLISCALAGAVCSWLFVWQERRAPEPLFPLHLAGNRIIRVCVGTTFCIGAANFGIAIFLPLFQQIVNGASATKAGLTVLPTSVGIVISTTVVGKLVTRTGKYRWYPLFGVIVFSVGIYLLSILGRGSPDWQVYGSTFVVGLGSGAASPIIMIAMQNSVRHEDLGVVSSLAMFSRTIGQVFGPALGSSLLIARFGTYFERGTDPATYQALGLREVRPESKPIGELAEPIRAEAVDAFRHAVNDSFRLATVFAVLGIVIACFMRSAPLRSSVSTEPLDAADAFS